MSHHARASTGLLQDKGPKHRARPAGMAPATTPEGTPAVAYPSGSLPQPMSQEVWPQVVCRVSPYSHQHSHRGGHLQKLIHSSFSLHSQLSLLLLLAYGQEGQIDNYVIKVDYLIKTSTSKPSKYGNGASSAGGSKDLGKGM